MNILHIFFFNLPLKLISMNSQMSLEETKSVFYRSIQHFANCFGHQMIRKTITFWGNFFPRLPRRCSEDTTSWRYLRIFITNNSVFNYLIQENDNGYKDKKKSSEKSMLWVSYVLTVIKYEDCGRFCLLTSLALLHAFKILAKWYILYCCAVLYLLKCLQHATTLWHLSSREDKVLDFKSKGNEF
jgi:hypothetical protein